MDSKNEIVGNVEGIAEKTEKDKDGNDITSTYFSNVSLEDNVLTFTRPDGSSIEINIE